MQHIKTYNQCIKHIKERTIIIEGPIEAKDLSTYRMESSLTAFRQPAEQLEALIDIAGLEEGRIIIARTDDLIIGYVTFLYPDPLERWSYKNLDYLLELGAIEVAYHFRGYQIGKELLNVSMSDGYMENYIIITTEYYWHWDLKNSGLDVFEYKNLMQRLMQSARFEVFQTNDPEITSHPANSLMARIGMQITRHQMQQFDEIRFMNRFFL
ncbi:GNAT family N-acetyltransferase [Abyssicoccus albus]|uniref:Acetoin utilization protein AcuA n=1 Tax=Abyssicoccus albus TaxID=1817405 RepID=A0A3N5BK21_9BACL|nr:GNAT family N-acetyltransferase [Abyssicoccus albus]RPF58224.1 acetoin utilization protein AcuA [Abyssicoccus albus]